jgi:hypothetical protein
MNTFEAAPSAEALSDLRESEEGHLVGCDPRKVPLGILSVYHTETNPLKALRARCLDCCCGSASEVRKCSAVVCPSWPFRMGVNPFRQKRTISEDRRRAAAQHFAKLREAREQK